jgi:hypothetical protein
MPVGTQTCDWRACTAASAISMSLRL